MSVTIIHKKGSGIPSADSLEVAEICVDVVTGKLYTKTDGGGVVEIGGGSGDGSGSSVHIGETPPADPEEGQQWMEVPADGDAVMWIYDDGNGGQWLQQPSGKSGGGGNIDEGTQDGIVATWDDTAKQWTPDSSLTIDSSGDVSIGTSTAGVAGLSIETTKNIGWTQSSGESLANMFRQQSSGALVVGCGYQYSSTANGFASSYSGSIARAAASFSDSISFYVDTASTVASGTDITPTERMRIGSDGRVDITGSLYVNGSPKIGASDLIRTLATLRNATKDETTLEGLRDAIGNAIGGLIEEFESQIETMPAPEEEKASTMTTEGDES